MSEIQISEAELRAMTQDLKQMHEDTFVSGLKRRGFLFGAAAVGGGALLAACGSDKKDDTNAGGTYTGDLQVVALAAALENLAVAAYGMALDAAGSGALGKVPAAVGEFVTVAKMQHADHAKAWNSVLTSAGKPAITGTPLTITDAQVAKLKAAKDVPSVAKVALGLETAAAQTYTFATSHVTSPAGIQTAATIAPVEAQHAAILHFILGEYPAPDSFLSVSGAVPPSALTA